MTDEFPPQKASNAESVSIWWRHHATFIRVYLSHLYITASDLLANVYPFNNLIFPNTLMCCWCHFDGRERMIAMISIRGNTCESLTAKHAIFAVTLFDQKIRLPYLSPALQRVVIRLWQCSALDDLSHWGRDKMTAISQTIFSNWFYWMKTSKPRFTGICAGNSPMTGEFPAQMASNAENVPFDEAIMTYYLFWFHNVCFRDWFN